MDAQVSPEAGCWKRPHLKKIAILDVSASLPEGRGAPDGAIFRLRISGIDDKVLLLEQRVTYYHVAH